jgi:hypothetical protein
MHKMVVYDLANKPRPLSEKKKDEGLLEAREDGRQNLQLACGRFSMTFGYCSLSLTMKMSILAIINKTLGKIGHHHMFYSQQWAR